MKWIKKAFTVLFLLFVGFYGGVMWSNHIYYEKIKQLKKQSELQRLNIQELQMKFKTQECEGENE